MKQTMTIDPFVLVENVAEDNNVPVNSWISVEDRMPKPRTLCVVVFHLLHCPPSLQQIGIAYFNGLYWDSSDVLFPVVTHWIPLPKPPKEEEK